MCGLANIYVCRSCTKNRERIERTGKQFSNDMFTKKRNVRTTCPMQRKSEIAVIFRRFPQYNFKANITVIDVSIRLTCQLSSYPSFHSNFFFCRFTIERIGL